MVALVSLRLSNSLITPPFSDTNTRPSGAKAIFVGSVRPEMTVSSWKPFGTAAAARAGRKQSRAEAMAATANAGRRPWRSRSSDVRMYESKPRSKLAANGRTNQANFGRIWWQPTRAAVYAPAHGRPAARRDRRSLQAARLHLPGVGDLRRLRQHLRLRALRRTAQEQRQERVVARDDPG